MGWRIDDIKAERKAAAEKRFESSDRAALIDHIADIEAALYTLASPLSGLDIVPGPKRSAWATSKLFPDTFGKSEFGGKYAVCSDGKFIAKDIPDTELHAIEYATIDSIQIADGSKLSDDFEVIAVHQNAIAAFICCGSISMKDIRRAAELLWPKNE